MIPRIPYEGDVPRDVSHVPIEELTLLVVTVLRYLVGVDRAGLIVQVSRVLGFASTGKKITDRINKAIEFALAKKFIVEEEGQLKLPD